LFLTWLIDHFNYSKLYATFFLIQNSESISNNNSNDSVYKKFIDFINIWPFTQWVFSLLTLILMYWLIGSWYNKKLLSQGGWISWKIRIIMIIIDLMLNLVVGIYFMGARDTLMGELMVRCPIAISPIIFVIEFIIFIWYYKKYVLKKKIK